MAYRTEIERALDEMISDETGKKFQGLAVVHAKQKWPQLIACERNWDGGLDAYASGELDQEGRGIGLACSITATPAKVEGDAKEAKKNYPDLRVLIFSTAREVTQHTAKMWTKDVLDKHGLQLVVVPRRVHHLAARSGKRKHLQRSTGNRAFDDAGTGACARAGTGSRQRSSRQLGSRFSSDRAAADQSQRGQVGSEGRPDRTSADSVAEF